MPLLGEPWFGSTSRGQAFTMTTYQNLPKMPTLRTIGGPSSGAGATSATPTAQGTPTAPAERAGRTASPATVHSAVTPSVERAADTTLSKSARFTGSVLSVLAWAVGGLLLFAGLGVLLTALGLKDPVFALAGAALVVTSAIVWGQIAVLSLVARHIGRSA